MKNCLGIEIGYYRIKIAYAEKGELKEFISERVQGMDLTDMHVCADLIKDFIEGICDPVPECGICHPSGGCVCAAV